MQLEIDILAQRVNSGRIVHDLDLPNEDVDSTKTLFESVEPGRYSNPLDMLRHNRSIFATATFSYSQTGLICREELDRTSPTELSPEFSYGNQVAAARNLEQSRLLLQLMEKFGARSNYCYLLSNHFQLGRILNDNAIIEVAPKFTYASLVSPYPIFTYNGQVRNNFLNAPSSRLSMVAQVREEIEQHQFIVAQMLVTHQRAEPLAYIWESGARFTICSPQTSNVQSTNLIALMQDPLDQTLFLLEAVSQFGWHSDFAGLLRNHFELGRILLDLGMRNTNSPLFHSYSIITKRSRREYGINLYHRTPSMCSDIPEELAEKLQFNQLAMAQRLLGHEIFKSVWVEQCLSCV